MFSLQFKCCIRPPRLSGISRCLSVPHLRSVVSVAPVAPACAAPGAGFGMKKYMLIVFHYMPASVPAPAPSPRTPRSWQPRGRHHSSCIGSLHYYMFRKQRCYELMSKPPGTIKTHQVVFPSFRLIHALPGDIPIVFCKVAAAHREGGGCGRERSPNH